MVPISTSQAAANAVAAGDEEYKAMTGLDDLAAVFGFLGDTGLLRMVIIVAVLFGLWRGLERAGFRLSERTGTWLAVAVPLVAWAVLVWQLALGGVFQARSGGSPALPIAILAPVVAGLLLIARSRRVAAALDALPASWLVGLQVYRVFGGAFLVQLALGKLTAAFAVPAGIGDVLVGILAVPVALYLNRGTVRGRAIALAWNALGILDLVVAITMGFLTATGRIGTGSGPTLYPLVMIPAFAVPLSLILHGVSIWQLARRAKRQTSSRDQGGAALARTPA
jgi:hypothetical protein